MEPRHRDAIISLSRLDDWKHLMDFVAGAVRELEGQFGFVDPTDALGIAKMQGTRTALLNILDLENSVTTEEQS